MTIVITPAAALRLLALIIFLDQIYKIENGLVYLLDPHTLTSDAVRFGLLIAAKVALALYIWLTPEYVAQVLLSTKHKRRFASNDGLPALACGSVLIGIFVTVDAASKLAIAAPLIDSLLSRQDGTLLYQLVFCGVQLLIGLALIVTPRLISRW